MADDFTPYDLLLSPLSQDEGTSLVTAPPAPYTRFKGLCVFSKGLAIFLAILAPVITLLAQLVLIHEFRLESDALVTSAPLGPTLTIVHACSTIATATVPFVMGIEAYWLSRAWLKASPNGENRPTPSQLGLLMSVIHGANLSALWAGLPNKKQTARRPHILHRAIALLLLLLGLVHACIVLETWLSASSDVVPFSQAFVYDGSWPLMTKQLNQTLCDADNYICGLENNITGESISAPEGLRTITNVSTSNSIAFLDDQTAIVVPSVIPDHVEFLARSYGVHTTCKSITSLCVNADIASQAFYMECPPSTNVNNSSSMFGALDPSGNVYQDVATNPFHFGAVVTSGVYVWSEGKFTGDTGFYTLNNVAYNVLSCYVDVVSIIYRYANDSFITNNTIAADLNMTRRVALFADTGYISGRLPIVVEGAGLVSGDYAAEFALELSRELIAMTAYTYEPGESLEMHTVQSGLGARLQLVPLVLLATVLIIYCVTTMVITVLAATAQSSTTYVALARNRLADPMTLVHSAFCFKEADRTWKEETMDMFGTEKDTDRLGVGPMNLEHGRAFGVSRSPPL